MPEDALSEQVAAIIAYHQTTKHHFQAFAPGPGYLDWANQPDPSRRYLFTDGGPVDDPRLTTLPAYEEYEYNAL